MIPKIAQIIVAGGSGQRAGGDVPKQYQSVAEISIIHKTLAALLKLPRFPDGHVNDDSVHQLVVYAQGDGEILDAATQGMSITKTTGGGSRTESVRAGLHALQDNPPEFVMIHDAARPFVSPSCLKSLLLALETHQAAVPVLLIADAVKSFEDGNIGEDVERSHLRRVQTPQAFRYADIMKAFDDLPVGLALPDDIAVALRAGLTIKDVEGDEANFKITYPSDFEKAEAYVKQANMTETIMTYTATGMGYDVHRYTDGDGIWLCGIKVPAPYTLLGHSDADAGLHALTDAIFGALADGDIGDHFPPSDPKWKGASSDQFLEFAVAKVTERGGSLKHVDVTLICEKPKVKPHRAAMRQRISELTGLPLSRVSVKATTTERLGFTGREEGLAAQAVATVVLPE